MHVRKKYSKIILEDENILLINKENILLINKENILFDNLTNINVLRIEKYWWSPHAAKAERSLAELATGETLELSWGGEEYWAGGGGGGGSLQG
jgi:hypothetical protein